MEFANVVKALIISIQKHQVVSHKEPIWPLVLLTTIVVLINIYNLCLNGACQCLSTFPFWSSGYNTCIVPASYSQTCLATSDCVTSVSLVCNSGTTCSCPTSLSSGKCDCVARVTGNENFWNGSSCVPAYSYNQTCTSSSTNYMCQTLTQGTNCIGGICKCSTSEYFNFANGKCETLLSVNAICNQIDACNSGLGLSCQNGVCLCNSTTQFWYISSCTNYFTYNSQTCSNSNQCAGILICNTNNWGSCNSCSCPSNVCSNKCDCPVPIIGSEYYWNGTYCENARNYGDSCTADYECQTLTQLTYCNTFTSKCDCATNSNWNSTICIGCPNGWKFYRGSCFYGSTSQCSNPQTNFNPSSDCNGESTARLAILYPSDVGNSFASSFSNSEYWIDFYRTAWSGTTGTFYSSNSQSSSTYIPSYWDSPWSNGDQCATWMRASNKEHFNARQCSNNLEVMCEIVL